MKNPIVVADQFRLNELSLKPGGSTVTVIHRNGDRRIYTRIKNPKRYIEKVARDMNVIEVLVEGDSFWKR